MAEEHVTTYKPPSCNTTVIYEGPVRTGNGSGWTFGIVLLIAVLVTVYMMAARTSNSTARDNAITHAASEVGPVVRQTGNAAQDTANKRDTAK